MYGMYQLYGRSTGTNDGKLEGAVSNLSIKGERLGDGAIHSVTYPFSTLEPIPKRLSSR